MGDSIKKHDEEYGKYRHLCRLAWVKAFPQSENFYEHMKWLKAKQEKGATWTWEEWQARTQREKAVKNSVFSAFLPAYPFVLWCLPGPNEGTRLVIDSDPQQLTSRVLNKEEVENLLDTIVNDPTAITTGYKKEQL